MHQLFSDIATAALAFAQALIPAALGSAVSQAYKKGLGWRDRLIQWVVGICVSWFVTRAIDAFFGLDPFVVQAIGFVVGMIAFESSPRFIAGASDALGDLPSRIRDFFFPKKG